MLKISAFRSRGAPSDCTASAPALLMRTRSQARTDPVGSIDIFSESDWPLSIESRVLDVSEALGAAHVKALQGSCVVVQVRVSFLRRALAAVTIRGHAARPLTSKPFFSGRSENGAVCLNLPRLHLAPDSHIVGCPMRRALSCLSSLRITRSPDRHGAIDLRLSNQIQNGMSHILAKVRFQP